MTTEPESFEVLHEYRPPVGDQRTGTVREEWRNFVRFDLLTDGPWEEAQTYGTEQYATSDATRLGLWPNVVAVKTVRVFVHEGQAEPAQLSGGAS
jgi:hypothetical protein